MTDEHASSDELLDYALSQLDASTTPTEQSARIETHVSGCVACRVRLTRLQRAEGYEEPSDSIIDQIVANGPVLTDDVRTFLTSASREEPESGDVWRVGVDDALLVWVRRLVNSSTVDVIPLVFDTEMADSESLLIPAVATTLQVPLAALIPVRIQIHRDAFLSKLGTLNINESVESIITAAREGRLHDVTSVGTPITGPEDRRIEFRQLVNDLLGDLTPIVYTEHLNGHGENQETPGETTRQRVEAATAQPAAPGSGKRYPDTSSRGRESLVAAVRADLTNRLGPSVICQPCETFSNATEAGTFTALLKVHYIDTSVLVVLFSHPNEHLPEPSQASAGVVSMLQLEADVNGVALASYRDLDHAMFMTRANLRPAFELPGGTRSDATATITGHALVDTLVKFLDGEAAIWETLERAQVRLPDFDVRAVARTHATKALTVVRKSGARSPQPAKREAWGNLDEDIVEAISQFVTEARNGDIESALALLGLDEQ
jgi:hypothetical protein